ncbi:MAG: RDD family protein [Bacillota bacterium]|uniref:RDD family protein n=1 Tax=Virgibacillus salarius TaxID=447199 RepID=A0A941DW65_9BACI|nr:MULTISPECIES: RDD family protein [Virgibacillus]NAZ07325.1 RDD family protein [Agaribacter marinus]MBR7794603.1 RDD family protein [Virgibacillus salarius]MCC2252177.1 RDD family protein [Virgibacillus sp. AGTR]MDY7045504.1 RDD family protein [Virgibacillus sp. M23]QRZ16345.1 RDD family protein [Virgibacillus sp. AGTR]
MTNYKPAGFWIRVLASLLDSLLISVLAAMIAAMINDQDFVFFYSQTEIDPSTSDTWASIIYIIVFIIIFTATKWKGSPGKIICNIQVVNTNMTQISIWKSIGRYLSYFVSALTLFIGYLLAGWNEEKKALHDMICQTRVVYRN